jgi:tight adherence protein C
VVVDAPDRRGFTMTPWLTVTTWFTTPLTGAVAAALAVALGGLAARPGARPRSTVPTVPAAAGAVAAAARRATSHGARLRRAGTVAVGVASVVLAGPLLVFVLAAVVALTRAARPVRAARRGRNAVATALPESIDLLVHAIRAGLTPHEAVMLLAEIASPPIRPGFSAVVHCLQRGQPLPDALRALPELLGPPAGGVADVLAAGVRSGLPLAPVLDQLSGEARDARRRRAEVDARRLPVRLSFPLVTCTLPSFVLLAVAPAVIAALSSLGGTAR